MFQPCMIEGTILTILGMIIPPIFHTKNTYIVHGVYLCIGCQLHIIRKLLQIVGHV
jgi:hypothetical protein